MAGFFVAPLFDDTGRYMVLTCTGYARLNYGLNPPCKVSY